nr:MAG TPA: leucine rich repeat protein [Caudoviricetes sp.]
MSVNIKYKNSSIAELTDTGTKTLKTAGKYCEADIIVENTKDGGGAKEPYIEETYDRFGNLTTAVLHGLPKIRSNMFAECNLLTSVTIPNSVTEIGFQAFFRCSGLESLTLPDSVTIINSEAFRQTGLMSFTIPSTVINIFHSVFYACGDLTSVTFNGTPNSIGSGIFRDCPKLTTINVPWAEGAVSGAPWGATNATINYNYKGA